MAFESLFLSFEIDAVKFMLVTNLVYLLEVHSLNLIPPP